MRRFGVVGVIASAAVVAGVLIGASLIGGDSAPAPSRSAGAPALAGTAETRVLLNGIPQDGIMLGSPGAPVTLVEFADLQCPYCAHWARDAFPAVVDEYVRPGRVRLVFRGLAFIGPDSDTGLRAALAAGRQDRLWDVLHLLYANQGAENGGWVTTELLTRVGSSVRRFDDDRWLAGFRLASVERELESAGRIAGELGVSGTPTFFGGRTGGKLAPLALRSLDAAEMRTHLDRLLAE